MDPDSGVAVSSNRYLTTCSRIDGQGRCADNAAMESFLASAKQHPWSVSCGSLDRNSDWEPPGSSESSTARLASRTALTAA